MFLELRVLGNSLEAAQRFPGLLYCISILLRKIFPIYDSFYSLANAEGHVITIKGKECPRFSCFENLCTTLSVLGYVNLDDRSMLTTVKG